MPDNEIAKDGVETNEAPPDIQDGASLESVEEKPVDGRNAVEPEMTETMSAPAPAAAAEPQKQPSKVNGAASAPMASSTSADESINKISSMDFEHFSKTGQAATPHNIDMLLDVAMPVSIELGRTTMPIQDILNLGPGSVVELNKLAGEPVDLLVNDKLIAKGEVVVVDENFGIRITSMISQEERIKSLG